jgi:hypothetical protein
MLCAGGEHMLHGMRAACSVAVTIAITIAITQE